MNTLKWKQGTITWHPYGKGETQSPGLVSGPFGIMRSPNTGGWSLTHLPSGLGMGHCATRARCKELAEALAEKIPADTLAAADCKARLSVDEKSALRQYVYEFGGRP